MPVPFSANTRLSGLDAGGRTWRKGAVDSLLAASARQGRPPPSPQAVEQVARSGGTPLAVAEDGRLLGVIELKDVVKPGIRDRFAALRRMGIRTVMVTGDNRVTAAAIAGEAGVDDFIAEATPQDKLGYIRAAQAEGRLVAMCGDGTNDAPALAQADVGVAMQTGTQAAREAANMVDLDSDPTKLIEIVEIGKQLLITRGALTTFSIANDIAKYFAILPAIFVVAYPGLSALNVMRLSTPQSAILSAVIFNALVIIALVPLALRGVRFKAVSAASLLRRNLLIYGLGGIVVPFVGIKLIDRSSPLPLPWMNACAGDPTRLRSGATARGRSLRFSMPPGRALRAPHPAQSILASAPTSGRRSRSSCCSPCCSGWCSRSASSGSAAWRCRSRPAAA